MPIKSASPPLSYPLFTAAQVVPARSVAAPLPCLPVRAPLLFRGGAFDLCQPPGAGRGALIRPLAAAFRLHVWTRLAMAFHACTLFYRSMPQRPRIRYPFPRVSDRYHACRPQLKMDKDSRSRAMSSHSPSRGGVLL